MRPSALALKALLSPSPDACSDNLVSLDDQWDEEGAVAAT